MNIRQRRADIEASYVDLFGKTLEAKRLGDIRRSDSGPEVDDDILARAVELRERLLGVAEKKGTPMAEALVKRIDLFLSVFKVRAERDERRNFQQDRSFVDQYGAAGWMDRAKIVNEVTGLEPEGETAPARAEYSIAAHKELSKQGMYSSANSQLYQSWSYILGGEGVTEEQMQQVADTYTGQFEFGDDIESYYLQSDLLGVLARAFSSSKRMNYKVLLAMIEKFEGVFNKTNYAYLLLPKLLSAVSCFLSETCSGYINKDSLSEEQIAKIEEFLTKCRDFIPRISPIDYNVGSILDIHGITAEGVDFEIGECENSLRRSALEWRKVCGNVEAALEMAYGSITRIVGRHISDVPQNHPFRHVYQRYVESGGKNQDVLRELLTCATRDLDGQYHSSYSTLPYPVQAQLCIRNSSYDFLRASA